MANRDGPKQQNKRREIKMQTTTTTIDPTEQVVFAMLQENTGMSILDSGGTNGRMWQRNQELNLEDFRTSPRSWIDPKYGDVAMSLFHFMNEHLTYDKPLQAHFDAFASDYPDEGWLHIIEIWLDALGVATEGDIYSDARWSFNTYNFDGWLVSQTLQGSIFGLNGVTYGIIQVHGGADVRGGYTAPRVFRLAIDDFLSAPFSTGFHCSNAECENTLTVNEPHQYEMIDGDEIKTIDNPSDAAICSCGSHWASF